jgi:hypothetical protein
LGAILGTLREGVWVAIGLVVLTLGLLNISHRRLTTSSIKVAAHLLIATVTARQLAALAAGRIETAAQIVRDDLASRIVISETITWIFVGVASIIAIRFMSIPKVEIA